MDRDEALRLLRGGEEGVKEWNLRRHAGEAVPTLNGATLSGANLSGADLREARLEGAQLVVAHLYGANLWRAHLAQVILISANLTNAHLFETDLSGAELAGTVFNGSDITGANFAGARLYRTALNDLGLSNVRGLESVRFLGPCSVGLDTLMRSQGRIPEQFLRGCGFAPWQILEAKLYDPALTPAQVSDLQYKIFDGRTKGSLYVGGVFISYSHADAGFVEKVYRRLQDAGVSVWLDRHDMVAGALQRQIMDAIRVNDVVLLVLSEASVNSDWVEHELEVARKKEKEENRDVLCPVALDEAWKEKLDDVLWRQVAKKNVLDFSAWETDQFERQFQKLLKGLKIYYPPAGERA